MNLDFDPLLRTTPAIVCFVLYYLVLKFIWGLPGPEWGYMNHVDTFMVILFRSFLYSLPTILIFLYCKKQRSNERRELKRWGEEQEMLRRGFKNEITDEMKKYKAELFDLGKSIKVENEEQLPIVVPNSGIEGFDIQRFI